MKPFVKWAGGKTQLLKELNAIKPKSFKKYLEPFVGGGAFLLNLEPKKAIINDINKELINAFQVIKNDKEELLKELNKMVEEHNKFNKEFYLKTRNNVSIYNDIQKAARFIYLNKTCFNGLYRENSKGQFNVPFNGKDKIDLNLLAPIDNINQINKFLNNNSIDIKNEDYKKIIKQAKKNDFLFVDPPYDKEDKGSFTKYNKDDFNEQDQIELANELKKADKKGVKWIITNHNTLLINDLYKTFNRREIVVNRMINRNSDGRKKITKEVIFWNY